MLSCSNIFKAKEYIAPNISKKKNCSINIEILDISLPKEVTNNFKKYIYNW